MKCKYCNYESEGNFDQCPACGAPVNPTTNYGSAGQNYQTYSQYPPYNYYANSNAYNNPHKKIKGENAAIVTAIIVSILSVIAAFVLFVFYSVEYYPAPTDFMEDFDNTYSDFPKIQMDNPPSVIEKHSSVEFNEKLYSFSNGYVDTEYKVQLEETYRGEAALKLLDGAVLPKVTDSQEIFLVKFKVTVTNQDTKSYVTLYPSNSLAVDIKSSLDSYSFNSSFLDSLMHPGLDSINYANQKQLLIEGESGTRWMAFVINKDSINPYVIWNENTLNFFFNNNDDSISDPAKVTKGEAVDNTQDQSSDDMSSDGVSSK